MIKFVFLEMASIVCVGCAAFLAYSNVSYWGWFLVLAVLLSNSYPSEKA
jgi:hypothetical protein